jgi:DNA-binding IclR family transcriptional regulator
MVPALERGLKVLELFSRDEPEIQLIEIARRMALPKSSAYRLTYTLERLGYLKRSPGGFRLAASLLALGFEYLASQDLIEIAGPELAGLRDETGATALLSVLEDRQVICIAQAASHKTLATRVPIGARYPAHVTAMGRVLLAALSDDALARLYAGARLESFTENTLPDFAALKTTLQQDRRRGYAISRGAFQLGIVAVGAVIRNAKAEPVAAISVVGPALELEASADGPVKDSVLKAARHLSELLGHRS